MKIAIVEDKEPLSDNYRAILEAAWDDVIVDQLYNEDQARTAFQRAHDAGAPYNLITLDIELSDAERGKNERGGLRLLADMPPGQRSTVIVVSGTLGQEALPYIQDLKPRDILEKPHTDADYLKAVRLGLQIQQKRSNEGVMTGTQYQYHDLILDPYEGRSSWRGKPLLGVTLTHQRLLWHLTRGKGAAVSIKALGKALTKTNPTEEAVRVQISELRRILRNGGGTNEFPIETVLGSGYRWVS